MSEESKIIEKLFCVLTELHSRENSHNCVVSELMTANWYELCDYGIELFNKLKC